MAVAVAVDGLAVLVALHPSRMTAAAVAAVVVVALSQALLNRFPWSREMGPFLVAWHTHCAVRRGNPRKTARSLSSVRPASDARLLMMPGDKF